MNSRGPKLFSKVATRDINFGILKKIPQKVELQGGPFDWPHQNLAMFRLIFDTPDFFKCQKRIYIVFARGVKI